MQTTDSVVIDGYNLIKRVPALAARLVGAAGLDTARSYLLGSLRAYQARRGRRVVLVLDGPRNGRSDFGPVEVVYATNADDAVIALAGQGCLVVSSDTAVRQGAISRGAAVLSSEDFWQALIASGSPRRQAVRSAAAVRDSDNPRGRGAGAGRDDEDRSKPTRGNPKRKSKAEKRREQARTDLMRRV